MKTLDYLRMFFVVAIIPAIFMIGCSKDEEDKLSRTEMLTRNWNVTSIDAQSVMSYSGLDYIYLEFESDGDLKFTVALSGTSISLVYDWSWIDNEQTILIDDGTEEYEWHVQKLTDKDLWFVDTGDQSTYKCTSF